MPVSLEVKTNNDYYTLIKDKDVCSQMGADVFFLLFFTFWRQTT